MMASAMSCIDGGFLPPGRATGYHDRGKKTGGPCQRRRRGRNSGNTLFPTTGSRTVKPETMLRTVFALGLFGLLLSGCATLPWPEPDSHCRSGGVLLDAHFDGGNLGKCSPLEDGTFRLILFPEDDPPINRSTWYAFRVSGRAGDEVAIRLEHEHGYARYWPKISRDGRTWERLGEGQVTRAEEKEWMEIRLSLDGSRLWVAGQEIIDGRFYDEWLSELAALEEVSTRLLGQSVEGRPIYLAETAGRSEFVLFMGRQHPPEVSGAFAMRTFMDTVFGDSVLARAFRERFQLGIVPLVNPDGVAGGHWRHNVNGVDVNRDWGPFTQPESRAVIRWVEQQEARGGSLRLMLDFHSTWEDLFYTQPVSENPPDYASVWLGAAAARLPDFPFKHEANPVSDQPNAKNYFYTSRGIPAITYEVGDETARDSVRAAAVVFAEEMMRTLLETPSP
jgi:hypothetical protein